MGPVNNCGKPFSNVEKSSHIYSGFLVPCGYVQRIGLGFFHVDLPLDEQSRISDHMVQFPRRLSCGKSDFFRRELPVGGSQASQRFSLADVECW